MKSVVWDIMLADQLALQNTQSDPKLNLKNESFRLYSQVFSIHKISSKQYFKSYRYYQEHPALYKDLMLQVKQLAEKDKNVPQQKLH